MYLSHNRKCAIVITRLSWSVRLSFAYFSHFWLRWKVLTEFNAPWQEARFLPRLCFFGRSENQDGRHCLWLAEIFSTFPLKPLNKIQRNSKRSKIFITFGFFFWQIEKPIWQQLSLIGWTIFDISSKPPELNSTKLNRKQDLNVHYPVSCFWADGKAKWPPLPLIDKVISTSLIKKIQRHWIGSKISTSVTKFFFWGWLEKPRCLAQFLTGWYIFDFSSETAEKNQRN